MQNLIRALESIAPPAGAEEWDNVGLLLEPAEPRPLRRVLLTIDLTGAVMQEALDGAFDFIVAYHPPLFHPVRRLVMADAGARPVLRAAAAGIPVYSPHTALDNVEGGINDWLADGLGAGDRTAIDPDTGAGRLVTLDAAVPLDEVAGRIRAHLDLPVLRVAPVDRPVRRVALCAGAGASVLAGTAADLFWTGEMRHHDVLAANAADTSVILCEHTHTERGYLPILRDRLRDALGGDIEFACSAFDRDPLSVQAG